MPPAATEAERERQIDALLEQATREIELGNTQRAVSLAESAFALDPDNEDARAIVAFARVRARRRTVEHAGPAEGATPDRPQPLPPDGTGDAGGSEETSGDRRRLSVLFCDVVGSTELAGRLDPEDVRELLRAFQAAAAAAIESYGGTVARFIGDGILAYFGFPKAHEDDAARAALAGRAMVAAVDRLAQQTTVDAGGWRLAIRVGIHTGLVVVADMGGGRRVEPHDIVGDAANIAARVQGEAPAGQVLISEATLELARPFIEVEEHGTPPLKGVARPVTLYRVLGERRVPLRDGTASVTRIPLVGRQEERTIIDAAWSGAPDQGSVVFVRGHAGIGKSRLVAHATDLARASGGTVLVMQCASLRANESLWPVDEAIRHVVDTGTPAQRALVERLATTEHDPAQSSPAKQREERFRALVDWIDALGAAERLLLVVEDLHWADATTYEFVQRLAARSPLGRFVLLLTSREPLPFIAAEVQSVELEPLSVDDCALMIEHLVDDPEQRSTVRDAVISRSDGVPLFINELTKVVVGSGSETLEFNDDNSVPVALHDLLVARVDQFAEQRRVAEALAAFGQPTDVDRLSSVLEQSDLLVVRDLDALEAGGLIRRVGERYEFVHVLLRDAVLRLQLRPQRRALHQRIARSLELARGADESVDDAIIAHHHHVAGDHRRAAELWLRSGGQALRRNAQVEATELLQAALAAVEKMPESPERTILELDVVMALGPALINSKGYGAPDVEAVCLRAYELCEAVGDVPQRVPALINLWSFLASRAQHDEALALSATIMDLAEATGRDDLVLQARSCVGISNAFIGHLAEATAHFEWVIEQYDPDAHAHLRFEYGNDPAVIAYSYLANLRVFVGDEAGARALMAKGEAFARTLKHPFSEAFALCFIAQTDMLLGDLDDAELRLVEAEALCTREAIPPIMPMTYNAVLQGFRNDPSAAEACEFATAIARMAGLLVNVSYIESVHAVALSARGEHDAAIAKIGESVATMEATDERWAESDIRRRRAWILEGSGAPADEVEQAYREAIEVARRIGATGLESLAEAALARWLARSPRPPAP